MYLIHFPQIHLINQNQNPQIQKAVLEKNQKNQKKREENLEDNYL